MKRPLDTILGERPWAFMTIAGLGIAAWAYVWGIDLWLCVIAALLGVFGLGGWSEQQSATEADQIPAEEREDA